MCGGAIISDLISASRRRVITADYLRQDVKKIQLPKKGKPGPRSDFVGLAEDDFEADFQEFQGESDDDVEDVKPFAFPNPDVAPSMVLFVFLCLLFPCSCWLGTGGVCLI